MRRLVLLPLLAVVACSPDSNPRDILNLDGPTDIAFACYGDLRIVGDNGVADPEDPIVLSAQPIESCVLRQSGQIPPGQEPPVGSQVGLSAANWAFVLQPTNGSVALLNIFTNLVFDTDPLTPGRNAIPVGTLPVGIVADQSGCHMMTANAGSCDLSQLDVGSAISSAVPASVLRTPFTSSIGTPIAARPQAIVGPVAGGSIGEACGAAAQGNVYVSFPGCGLVAAVNAATGQVVAGVTMAADGTGTLTSGDVTCPVECAAGMTPPPTAGTSPLVIERSPDGTQLFIGSRDHAVLNVVRLDPVGVPVSIESVVLEGEIGVTSITGSDLLDMGGSGGGNGSSGVQFQFAYVAATDGSIRVVDLGGSRECDTQVDPRFLADERDLTILSCFTVGDAATPPRRANADGPGIRLPGAGIPLDMEIVNVDNNGEDVDEANPREMVGTFAFVSSSNGGVFIINIDDNNYPDFESLTVPTDVWMSLALPHQPRDFVRDRSLARSGAPSCEFLAEEDPSLNPPRLTEEPVRASEIVPLIADDKFFENTPFLRTVECVNQGTDVNGDPFVVQREAVPELAHGASALIRERSFGDLSAIRDEGWTMTWEGSLSRDTPNVSVDGSAVRTGFFQTDAGGFRVTEGGAPYCAFGVEPYDFVELIGCDPRVGDIQCGLDQTCLVHPAAPASVNRGLCVPTDQALALTNACRSVLVSDRIYSIATPTAGALQLSERRRVLRTGPLDGCVDATECESLAILEQTLGDAGHPVEQAADPPNVDLLSWSCEADPTRAPGVDRCVMTCADDAGCENGFVCSAGYCVSGTLPPPECLASLQSYVVRGGESFVAIGSTTGYVHDRIADTTTGECIADPNASPLLRGRVRLRPDPCSGDLATDVAPNPCATTVEHFEETASFTPSAQSCEAQPSEFGTRTTDAIRFSNPAFTIHLVDMEQTGDDVCIGDGAGTLQPFAPLYTGYSIAFGLVSGFRTMFVDAPSAIAAFPSRLRLGPDGLLWLLDQGDLTTRTGVTQGRVITIDPNAASNQFAALPTFF